MDSFASLGRDIEGQWRSANYDESRFPEIAVAALNRASLTSWVSPTSLLSDVLDARTLPTQIASEFGEPGVTVHSGNGFFVDALFWLDGTTTIHQHAFSGAFQVVAGSSIHTTYAFHRDHRVSSKLILGDLQFQSSEWLRVGDIREIRAGQSFIHSLFHLERPSVTIVVRTFGERDHLPQFDYLRPIIAFDPTSLSVLARRQLECLRTLLRIDSGEYRRNLLSVLAEADPYVAVLALRQHVRASGDDDFDPLVEVMTARHGAPWSRLPEVLDEMRRQNVIVERRRRVTNPDHRFLLAALLNAPNRTALMSIFNGRFGVNKGCGDVVVDFVAEMANMPSTVSEQEPNALGVDMNADELLVFRKLANGSSVDEIVESLGKELPDHDIRLRDVAEYFEQLRRSVLFRPLFR